jgi:hypothetical protein
MKEVTVSQSLIPEVDNEYHSTEDDKRARSWQTQTEPFLTNKQTKKELDDHLELLLIPLHHPGSVTSSDSQILMRQDTADVALSLLTYNIHCALFPSRLSLYFTMETSHRSWGSWLWCALPSFQREVRNS